MWSRLNPPCPSKGNLRAQTVRLQVHADAAFEEDGWGSWGGPAGVACRRKRSRCSWCSNDKRLCVAQRRAVLQRSSRPPSAALPRWRVSCSRVAQTSRPRTARAMHCWLSHRIARSGAASLTNVPPVGSTCRCGTPAHCSGAHVVGARGMCLRVTDVKVAFKWILA